MTTNSQAGQDVFAYTITNKKQNGYFLEIGANHPISCNNTYVLEKDFNWKGLMVEYDSSFEELYKIHRPKSIYQIMDARNVNYRNILDENNYSENMDYLQIDLDVDNRSTLDTLILLDNTVFDKYKFATVTFEHDIYSGDYFNTQIISREIFKKRGYILVFPNVSVFWQGEYKPFEDWYVHPDLVNMDYVNSIITDRSLTCEEIKKILLQ
jgi:hypothetical protein